MNDRSFQQGLKQIDTDFNFQYLTVNKISTITV